MSGPMIKPREVDDVIDAMKAAGWPDPEVFFAHFRRDETGPMAITLTWPLAVAQYETERGWVGVYGGMGGICPAPFTIPPLPSEDVPGYLLHFGRDPSRKSAVTQRLA